MFLFYGAYDFQEMFNNGMCSAALLLETSSFQYFSVAALLCSASVVSYVEFIL